MAKRTENFWAGGTCKFKTEVSVENPGYSLRLFWGRPQKSLIFYVPCQSNFIALRHLLVIHYGLLTKLPLVISEVLRNSIPLAFALT